MTNAGSEHHRSTPEAPLAAADQIPLTAPSPVPPAFLARLPKAPRKSSVLSIAVTAFLVPGLFATVALPAYAIQSVDTTAADASAALQQLKASDAQRLTVAAAAQSVTGARDGYTATSAEDLAAEQARAAYAAIYASYSGPSIEDLLANPPYPNFDLSAVAAVAQQYQGVPYVFGGNTPAGFDCSGFVSFVYAQFGIAMPHSVSGIAAMGTPIAVEAALPGDIVTLPGHNGIYLGNGMFIDAPDYGDVVRIRPIYDSNFYIVRIGI